MARFPGPENAPGPSSMRPTRGVVREDSSGFDRGLADLTQGIGMLGNAAANYAADDRKRRNTADLAAAEARWLQGSLDIKNRFQNDNDYSTFEERASEELATLKEEAGALIRDDEFRASWLGDVELKRIATFDAIRSRGQELEHEDNRLIFEESLSANSDLFSNPETADEVREQAMGDMAGALIRGIDTGIISRTEAQAMKERYMEGAEEKLALSRMALDTLIDPASVMAGTGIPAMMGGTDLGVAISASSGGITELPLDVARMAAESLGDRALPSNPELAAAYLKDPENNARYAGEAVDLLTQKYKGDQTAAVIAIVGGEKGDELAREWVKSGHDEGKLPPEVRAKYRDVMGRISAPLDLIHYPVTAAPGVDLENVNVDVLDRFEKLQSVFGASLLITSGKRDPEHNDKVGGAKGSQHLDGNAIDIDTSKMKREEVLRLIETASAMGFGGIGIYEGSIHIDLGKRRAWGPSYGKESVPEWAADLIKNHQAGKISELPLAKSAVNPRYSKLSFDQRMQGYTRAKQAMDQISLETRAGIEVAVENAPQAVLSTGAYDGYTPTVEDFVEGYGAAEGIPRFKSFQGQMEVARDTFSMRTMSYDEIATLLEQKAPTASGDMAAYEAKRYDALVQAAAATKEAREKDPAGYVLSVMPGVAEKFEAAAADPENSDAYAEAITAMSLAQDMLGIQAKELLPKQHAAQAAAAFNNKELPSTDRIAALTSAVFATNDEAQQRAILDQLQREGVPEFISPAMAALARGDEGAARHLFRAAIVDPKDLPGELEYKPAEIREAITAQVYDEGLIGDVVYGLSGGTAENWERAMTDNTLFERAVKLRLADGSATDLNDAIEKTKRDMWGDVKVIKGGSGGGVSAGLKLYVGSSENEGDIRLGFATLMPEVGDALFNEMTAMLAGAPREDGSLALGVAVRDNDITVAMQEGYFTNAGRDTFVFVDPRDGDAVPGPDGKPLTWTLDEIVAAGKQASAGMQTQQKWINLTGANQSIDPQNYYDIVGANRRPLNRMPWE